MKRYLLIFALINFSLIINGSQPSSLDSSFNETGILNISPTVTGSLSVQSLAIQSDGKIIYVGYVTATSVITSSPVIYGVIGRLTVNGAPDTTFNSGNYIVVTPNSTSLQSALFDVKIQDSGKIVVIGYTQQSTDNNFYTLLARYTSTGILDSTSSFGTGGAGYTCVKPTGYIGAQLYAVTLPLDGTIIVSGTAIVTQSGSTPTSCLPMIARYTSSGIIDTTFNSVALSPQVPGYAIVPASILTNVSSSYAFGGYNDLTIQDNRMIVVTGYIGPKFQSPFGTYYTSPVQGQMVIARYTNSGLPDPIFHGGNILMPSTAIVGTISMGFGIALQSDGQILVTGMANPLSTAAAYTIMRFNYLGTLDTSFNSSGPIPGINQSIFNDTHESSSQFIVIQPEDQKILTAGMNTSPSSNFNLVAIRYEQDGTIDTSFDFTTTQTTASLQFRAIALAPDKKIIAAGLDTISSYSFLFFRFLGGSTPEFGITSAVNIYGYNAAFLSNFLYVDFYAQTITNLTARNAALTSVSTIISTYITTYSNQPDFNYVSYAYLMNTSLLAAAATLNTTYETDTITQAQITQFFAYIIDRESQLLTNNPD
jgi:uncharacterized delta-60 repeat protein